MAFQYTKIKRFIRGRNFPLLKVITKSNNKDKSLIKAGNWGRQPLWGMQVGAAPSGPVTSDHWSLPPRHHQASQLNFTSFVTPEIQGWASQWAIMGKLLAAGQWGYRQNGRILSSPGDKWTFCETVKAINVWCLIHGASIDNWQRATCHQPGQGHKQLRKWGSNVQMGRNDRNDPLGANTQQSSSR